MEISVTGYSLFVCNHVTHVTKMVTKNKVLLFMQRSRFFFLLQLTYTLFAENNRTTHVARQGTSANHAAKAKC